MKKILFIVVIAFGTIACHQKTTDSEQVKLLKMQKDSLQTIYEGVTTQIAKIDEQLKDLDTTVIHPLVTVSKVKVNKFEHFVAVQGVVETGGNALLYPQVPGKIIAILKKEGNKVSKGDIILKLDASPLISTIKEVQTNYNLAKDIFEKQGKLWKDKIGSELQYLQAKNNKESLEQKLKTLNDQLDMYNVKAPFAGTIDEIKPNVGEGVNPAFPVVRVINYNDTYIKADVSENYIETIKSGNLVKVNFPNLHKKFETKIARNGDFINPHNRTFKIRININAFKKNVKPNLLANLNIRDFSQDTAVVIPAKIIQQDRQGNDYIFVLKTEGKKKTAKKIIVKTGLSYNGTTLIREGLKGGEIFINQGARSIQDGDVVDVASK